MERDAAYWNRRYAPDEYLFGAEPSRIAVRALAGRPSSRALCLGEGEGRHAAWLAEQGHVVVSYDLSQRGVDKTIALARSRGVNVDARVGDIRDLPWEPETYDIILMSHVHPSSAERAAVHRGVITSLRPGGVYFHTSFSPQHMQIGKGGPRELDRFVTPDDLRRELAPLQIDVHEEIFETLDAHGRPHRSAVTWAIAKKETSAQSSG